MNNNMVETLSERELQVLKALSEGLSNHEIAQKLYLAPNTVKWYVRQLNSKFESSNRDELVEVAQRHGLLNAEKQSSAPIKHNLPYQTSPFIGRDTELDELQTLLANPEIRLLSILAPGGMGKSRIALEAAEQQIFNFKDGVYFIPLQPLSEATQLVPQIAAYTGYQFQSDSRNPKEQVLDYLANKNMLLLTDNWEHLLEGVALLSEILQIAPDVKILATSREKLNLSEEAVYPLRGMQFPTWETPEDALQYDAVRLFLQAAKLSKVDWELKGEHLDYLARICRLTEGMPLGILLAASWLDVLSLEEIAQEIQTNVDFLETEMRNIPERQRSIRAVFEAAWKRLQPLEQQTFMRISIFRGGCTRRAAEVVTGANLKILQGLVNKALLTRSKNERFDIHELLRQYAEMALKETSEWEAVCKAHAFYYAEAMKERESQLYGGERQLESFHDIKTDFDNVRAAWIWAVEKQDWHIIDQMLNSLAEFYFWNGNFYEGKALLDMPLQRLNPEDKTTRSLCGRLQSRWIYQFGREPSVKPLIKEAETALQIAQETSDASEIAFCLRILGIQLERAGNPEAGLELVKEGLTIARAHGNRHGEIKLLLSLAYLLAGRFDQLEEAVRLTYEGITLARKHENLLALSDHLMNHGVYLLSTRHLSKAKEYLEESLRLREKIGYNPGIQHSLDNLIALAQQQGQFEEAEAYCQQKIALSRRNNYHVDLIFSLGWLAGTKGSQGDFHAALALCEEAKSLIRPGDSFLVALILGLPTSFAYMGLGDYAQASPLIYKGLAYAVVSDHIFGVLSWLDGVPMLLAYHHHLPERALELVSLIEHHPVVFIRAFNPLWQALLAHLKVVLPEDVYAAAWEHGKNLNLRETAKALVEEFAPK